MRRQRSRGQCAGKRVDRRLSVCRLQPADLRSTVASSNYMPSGGRDRRDALTDRTPCIAALCENAVVTTEAKEIKLSEGDLRVAIAMPRIAITGASGVLSKRPGDPWSRPAFETAGTFVEATGWWSRSPGH